MVVGDRLFFLLFLLSKRSHILALHRRGVALELLVVLGRGLGLVEDGHVQIVSVLLYLPMLKGVVVRSDLSMHQPASAVVGCRIKNRVKYGIISNKYYHSCQ